MKGEIVAQKLRMYPPRASYGSYVITVDDQEILNLSREVAKKLDLIGLIKFNSREMSAQANLG